MASPKSGVGSEGLLALRCIFLLLQCIKMAII